MCTGQPIYKTTIRTKASTGDRIGQRVRSTTNGHRSPDKTRSIGQHDTQNEQVRPRQTETNQGSRKPKLPKTSSTETLIPGDNMNALKITTAHVTETEVDCP